MLLVALHRIPIGARGEHLPDREATGPDRPSRSLLSNTQRQTGPKTNPSHVIGPKTNDAYVSPSAKPGALTKDDSPIMAGNSHDRNPTPLSDLRKLCHGTFRKRRLPDHVTYGGQTEE